MKHAISFHQNGGKKGFIFGLFIGFFVAVAFLKNFRVLTNSTNCMRIISKEKETSEPLLVVAPTILKSSKDRTYDCPNDKIRKSYSQSKQDLIMETFFFLHKCGGVYLEMGGITRLSTKKKKRLIRF